MLERLDENWDVIGAAPRPGNRPTLWAEGSFLLAMASGWTLSSRDKSLRCPGGTS